MLSVCERAVAIDMDGVVVDSMPYHVRAWQDAFAIADIHLPAERIYMAEGTRGVELIEQINREHTANFTDALKQEIFNAKQVYFTELFVPRAMPGITNLLTTFQCLGYPVALVTGSIRQTVQQVLSSLNLIDAFQFIVSADDVTNGKPSPEPYFKAVQCLGASYCFVLENAPMGIKSAKAANLPCIAVETSLGATHLMEADHIVPTLFAVETMVEKEYSVSAGVGQWMFENS